MNTEIPAVYTAAGKALRLMLTASGYATHSHELTALAVFGNGFSKSAVKHETAKARERLNQRIQELKGLTAEIEKARTAICANWERLQAVRDYSFAETGPFAVGDMLTTTIPAVQRWISETSGWLLLGSQYPVSLTVASQRSCNETAESFPLSLIAAEELRLRLLKEKSVLLKNIHVADPDPFSIGRMKRRWTAENPDLLDKQFELIRVKNPDRVRDAGGAGRGPWQFRKSLCREYGLNCPEFGESLP